MFTRKLYLIQIEGLTSFDFYWYRYVAFTLKIIFASITSIYFSDISGLIYTIIKTILMEQAQIFKLPVKTYTLPYFSQPTITCSKLTIETLEQGVKYVQS